MRSTKRDICFAALAASAALALAGCTAKEKPVPIAEKASPPEQPAPKPPAAPNPLRAINADLPANEAVWHLRSALNVAALACDRSGRLGIATAYNQLLARHRKPLASAYSAEGARFAARGALDAHVTRLYNQFARPSAQARFCAVAAEVAMEATMVAPDRLTAFAPDALDRLVGAFDHPAPETPRMAVATNVGPPWRIQLGAYSGDEAARNAWNRIRSRMKGAADFAPRYEDVPKSALVRIRIGPVNDRAQAISLCAAAASAGLDCLPVPPVKA